MSSNVITVGNNRVAIVFLGEVEQGLEQEGKHLHCSDIEEIATRKVLRLCPDNQGFLTEVLKSVKDFVLRLNKKVYLLVRDSSGGFVIRIIRPAKGGGVEMKKGEFTNPLFSPGDRFLFLCS